MNIPLNEWNGSKEVREALEAIDKRNSGQQRLMLWLTAIAAVGAVIAAVPVVWGWMH